MKKALLNFLIFCTISAGAFSQTVIVNSPASIAGVYPVFGTASFGPALASGIWTGDVALIKDASSTPPSLGCDSLLLNSGALKGKIALIDRGSCNFSLKVYNAQLAGAKACVIFNNVTGGGIINMSGVLHAADDTIPTVMLPFEDGVKIKAELAKGPVNMTLGNIIFPNDLATNNHRGICHAPYGTYPTAWLRKFGDFVVTPGASITNKGQHLGTGVKLNAKMTFTPDGGSPTEFYNKTSDPGIFVEVDSTNLITLDPQDLLGHAAGTGKGSITYLIKSDSLETSTSDNTAISEFYLSNDLFSKARISTGSRDPFVTNSYTRSDGANAEYITPYNIPYCKGCNVDSILFYLSINAPATLANVNALATLYGWNDANADGAATNDELTILAAGGFVFDPADTRTRAVVRVPLEDWNLIGVNGYRIPEDNFKVFVGVRNPGTEQTFVGFDEGMDYSCRIDLLTSAGTISDVDFPYFGILNYDGTTGVPDLPSAFIFNNGSGSRLYAAVASSMTLSDIKVGNNQLSDLEASVNLYPNPVKDKFVVNVSLNEISTKVIYNITDNNGKLIFQYIDNSGGKEYKTKFNVTGLTNGLYHMNLRTDKGYKNVSFEVLK